MARFPRKDIGRECTRLELSLTCIRARLSVFPILDLMPRILHVDTLLPPTGDCHALVFSGSGARGAACIGALAVLAERGEIFGMYGGTSSGGLIAALAAAGYTPDELAAAFRDLATHPHRMFDVHWWRMLRAAWSLDTRLLTGVLKGEAFAEYIEGLLRRKNVRLLADLPTRFFTTAADVDRGELVVIDSVADGILPAWLPVRATTSLPAIFPPVRIDDRWLVDGGTKTNYPVLPAIALGATRVTLVLVGEIETPHPAMEGGALEVLDRTLSCLIDDQLESDLYRARELIGADHLRVITLALPRTGTLSLTAALAHIETGRQQTAAFFLEK